MKKISHKTIHQLLISIAVLLITLQAPLANANSYSGNDLNSFTKIERNQKLSDKLPEGGMICNGELVIASKMIRRHLSCKENITSSLSESNSRSL